MLYDSSKLTKVQLCMGVSNHWSGMMTGLEWNGMEDME